MVEKIVERKREIEKSRDVEMWRRREWCIFVDGEKQGFLGTLGGEKRLVSLGFVEGLLGGSKGHLWLWLRKLKK